MGNEVIHRRFSRVVDMLDDARAIADEDEIERVRQRTRELESDYVALFDSGE